MSNFVANEESNYQTEVKQMIEDLVELVEETDGMGFSAFEVDFIESMGRKLGYEEIRLSSKQHETLFNIWEKYKK